MKQNQVLEDLLDQLEYPVSKPTLATEAREAALPASLGRAIERLPDREYASKDEVVRALGEDDPR